MSFEVVATAPFEQKLKRLSKKYKSLGSDLANIIDALAEKPTLGTPIGKECYKIRVAISSKGKGKSGGARMITYVRIVKKHCIPHAYLRQIGTSQYLRSRASTAYRYLTGKVNVTILAE